MKIQAIAVLIMAVAPIRLWAQTADPPGNGLRPVPLFPVVMPSAEQTLRERIASDPAYRRNHWKTGALVGAAVGLALGTLIVAECEHYGDSGDCPGLDRAAIVFVGSTGVGALIGALIPSGPPKAAEPAPSTP